MMKQTPLQKIDAFGRRAIPALFSLFLVLLSVTPLQIPDYATIAPAFLLMTVYYWAIYRPEVMPFILVFILGLLQDILSGGPPGMNACILLIAYGLVVSQRRFFIGKSFPVIWWGFMLLAAGAGSLAWVLTAILSDTVVAPLPGIFAFLMSIAVYPILTMAFAAIHRLLPPSAV